MNKIMIYLSDLSRGVKSTGSQGQPLPDYGLEFVLPYLRAGTCVFVLRLVFSKRVATVGGDAPPFFTTGWLRISSEKTDWRRYVPSIFFGRSVTNDPHLHGTGRSDRS